MAENRDHEDEQARRERLQSAVVMPDEVEPYEPKVDGTREVRRNAIAMIIGGLLVQVLTIAVLMITDNLPVVIFVLGFIMMGVGVEKLSSSRKR